MNIQHGGNVVEGRHTHVVQRLNRSGKVTGGRKWQTIERLFIQTEGETPKEAARQVREHCTGNGVFTAREVRRSHVRIIPRDQERVEELEDTDMPWCDACRSYHAVPRDAAMHASLQCFAPYAG